MKKVSYTKTTLREYRKLSERYKRGDLSCGFELASYLSSNWKWDEHSDIVKYYMESFELGNLEAAYELGLYYDADDNPNKSVKESLKWLRKAANAGNAEACNNLAFVLEHEFKNPVEANRWYLKGALRGSANAQYNLGISYEKGLGVKKSIKNALKFFKLAMMQDYPGARYKYNKIKK